MAQVSVMHASIAQMPFHDSVFDGLVCGDVLEHVEDDQECLREFRRVLRPEGIIVVTVPIREQLWSAADVWAGHLRRYDIAQLHELVSKTGFAVEKLEPYGFPFGRIYHWLVTTTIVSLPTSGREGSDQYAVFKSLGRHPWIVWLLAAFLDADRLLHIRSRASAVLIVGRKM